MSAVAVGRNLLKRARRGLYAGRMVLSGNKISEDGGNRCRFPARPSTHASATLQMLRILLDIHAFPFFVSAAPCAQRHLVMEKPFRRRNSTLCVGDPLSCALPVPSNSGPLIRSLAIHGSHWLQPH